ncbi:unnamed protein product [Nippostrongylus brasiliensis]|uniref:BZIP domain-containing protein n=1 Tax=Nippostrongylus brasiliensis TaxID=27835 RepID=A0A0N4XJE3_NIPBR|nr:unnamed protein product [Nippostrongylus brasiliensis]
MDTNGKDHQAAALVKNDIWKDIVSLDQSTREKPIPLKDLFPDTKVVDKTLKRKIANKKKRLSAKRRRECREERLKELNAEKEEKDKISYRESANRYYEFISLLFALPTVLQVSFPNIYVQKCLRSE